MVNLIYKVLEKKYKPKKDQEKISIPHILGIYYESSDITWKIATFLWLQKVDLVIIGGKMP